MNPQILHDYIIYPALEHMGSKFNTPVARALLLATAAQESHCGVYFKQVKGPALGIYQMEPATIQDLKDNFLKYHPKLGSLLAEFQSVAGFQNPGIFSTLGNAFYATALARLNYYRVSEALPTEVVFDDLWKYYKKYWNTELGAATEQDFQINYVTQILPVDLNGKP